MQTRLVDLVLNLLRKNQYQGTTPNTDELYLVTDDAGITSGDVTNALGYTPYDAANPNGFITNSQVGNGSITLKQDNDTYTFYVNQSANQTIDIKGLNDYNTFNNLSVQGIPEINGATVSYLTEADYVYTTTAITVPTYWEMWIKFTTGSIPSENDDSDQYIVGGSSATPDLAVYLNSLDRIQINIGGVVINTDFELISDTTYYLQLLWDFDDAYVYNEGLNVFLYDENKQYIDDCLLTGFTNPASMMLWFGTTYGADRGWDGSIDFGETYINKLTRTNNDEGIPELLWMGAERVIDTKADKSYVDTELATKANTDLGNITTTASKNFDGQWVQIDQVIASDVAFNTGGQQTKTYSLASYLPNDNYTYEVLFSIGGQTAATSGASFGFSLKSDLAVNVFVCRAIARSAAYVFAYGAATVPLTTKEIKVTQANTTSSTPTMTSLRMCAYRRVGTNT